MNLFFTHLYEVMRQLYKPSPHARLTGKKITKKM